MTTCDVCGGDHYAFQCRGGKEGQPRPPATAYRPSRDGRFEYASDAIDAIEEENCARGCKRGARPGELEYAFGPGGTCEILARVSAGDGEPVLELEDDGKHVRCLVREPLK